MQHWEINNSSNALLGFVIDNMEFIMPGLFPLQSFNTAHDVSYHIDMGRYLNSCLHQQHHNFLRPSDFDINDTVLGLLQQSQPNIHPTNSELNRITSISKDFLKNNFYDVINNDRPSIQIVKDLAKAFVSFSTTYQTAGNILSPACQDSYKKYQDNVSLLSRQCHNFELSVGDDLLKLLKQSLPHAHTNDLDMVIEVPFIGKIDQLPEVNNNIRSQTEFTKDNTKVKTGNMDGYFAYDNAGHSVLLKQAYRNQDQQPNSNLDRQSFVNETMTSEMYKHLLGNQAPDIILVRPDNDHRNSVYLASNIISNTQNLMDYIYQHPTIHNVIDFEKIIATSHILGDKDFHPLNILITPNGSNTYKIDHGEAMKETYSDIRNFLVINNEHFVQYGYIDNNKPTINFNITRYYNALRNLLQFDTHQACDIIDTKINELKSIGFNPNGLVLTNHINADKHVVNSYEDLGNYYKDFLIRNYNNMRNIAIDLEVISKFTNTHIGFREGKWLPMLANSLRQNTDIIQWAVQHNYMIEGQNPIIWAQQNHYKSYQAPNHLRHHHVVPLIPVA